MMDEKQAQELAQAIRLKSRAWMDDDLYGAFLRNEIFGSLLHEVRIAHSEKGDGFVVFSHWAYIDETFHSVEEWNAFAAKLEERMGLASLGYQGGAEQRGELNL